MADIEAAKPSASYRFTYTPISPLFMACMSGVEDVNGVVDAQRGLMMLTTLQRTGDAYSLDGELLVHRDLLGGIDSRDGEYARVRLDARTDTETRNQIDDSLGTSLSALIAGGAWPNHPTDMARALIPMASSIAITDPNRPAQRSIRIVLDADAYLDQLEETTGRVGDIPPIIDIHVASDGTIQRLAVWLAEADDPATVQDDGDGYAMDYDYDPRIDIAPPNPDVVFDIAPHELPAEPTPIPCGVEQ